MSVSERKFGVLQTGETVKIFHLENKSGAYAEVTDFGAILVKVCVPDKDGTLTDVVLGYDDLASYEVNGCFFGSTIGRNGNRIGGAKFSVNGKEVVLAQNENDNNLHSGPDGFEKKLWKVAEISDDKNSVIFNRISPDGENGFPGEFDVSVKYEFTEDNELRIHYQGICDEPTVANMTNHSYFNLNGEGSGTAMDQYLTIHAKYYTPVADSHSIPTGVYEEVAGTPMDFRTAKQIGQDIEAEFEQLKFTGGYDHNYVTDNYAKGNRRLHTVIKPELPWMSLLTVHVYSFTQQILSKMNMVKMVILTISGMLSVWKRRLNRMRSMLKISTPRFLMQVNSMIL